MKVPFAALLALLVVSVRIFGQGSDIYGNPIATQILSDPQPHVTVAIAREGDFGSGLTTLRVRR